MGILTKSYEKARVAMQAHVNEIFSDILKD